MIDRIRALCALKLAPLELEIAPNPTYCCSGQGKSRMQVCNASKYFQPVKCLNDEVRIPSREMTKNRYQLPGHRRCTSKVAGSQAG